jgi:hypothetical protein
MESHIQAGDRYGNSENIHNKQEAVMKMIGIVLILFLLVSCAPVPLPQQEPAEDIASPEGDTPSSEGVVPPTPELVVDNQYAPQESDGGLTKAQAFLEIADWVTADNKLHLVGSLSTPCHQLRVSHTLADGKLAFEVYSLIDPNKICAEMIQPFDVFLAVQNMPAEGISILVNGEVIFSQ